MKNVIELKKLFFACMVVGSTIVFSSCSDDDDKTPTPPAVTDAYGNYNGKMFVTLLEEAKQASEEESTGTEIAAEVKSDTVYFNNFPITDLVASIVGKELAPAIVEKIGEVNYKVGYKGSMNAANDSVYMVFDPKPLIIKMPGEGEEVTTVEVTISATDKGSYELSSKKLAFNLNAEELSLKEVNFKPTNFAFKLNKK